MNEDNFESTHLKWGDFTVIICYFAFILGVGLWSSRNSKKGSVSGYFLASRNMHWIPVGASIFASNIGSGHFISLAGAGAATGIGAAGSELKAIYMLMVLGWFFVPVYLSSGIYTMPQYLRVRFGGQRIRVYLSFLSLLLYIFTKISVDLYAGALFIQLAMNQSSNEWLYISILILLGIAALFTIAGGLAAVIWTDFVQTIIMIIGGFILMVIAFAKVGGMEGLITKYPYAIAYKRRDNSTCGMPPSDYMNLFRSVYPGESDLPWTGIWIGMTLNSFWYWCSDQVIVQRTLASKNIAHVKGGVILAAYLKHLPLWLMVFPGMIARILFQDRVGCTDPDECLKICNSPGGCTNIAYPELVIKLLPQGLAGLMLAVMMAALMSSLTSIFNSASTIFSIDVWTRFRKNPSSIEKVIVGKIFVVVLVLISILWIPFIQEAGNSKLFDYIMSVSSCLAPPISAIYVLAIFWPRTNEPGAFWGLMVGLLVGMTRFVLEFTFPSPSCGGEDMRPVLISLIVGKVHYLHFSIILFSITAAIAVSISLMTRPIPKECLYRLTFWSKNSKEVRKKIDQMSDSSEIRNDEAKGQEITKKEELARTKSSFHVALIYRLFGVRDPPASTTTTEAAENPEEQKDIHDADVLYEEPFWKKFVSINAIVCISVATFVFAFFA